MNIYVGNLSLDTTDEDLKTAFAVHGEVTSARVVTDRYTARSRGFGFVEMPTRTEAEAAMKALNGKEFKGRSWTANEARPKTEAGRGGGYRGGSGGGAGGDRGGYRGGGGGPRR